MRLMRQTYFQNFLYSILFLFCSGFVQQSYLFSFLSSVILLYWLHRRFTHFPTLFFAFWRLLFAVPGHTLLFVFSKLQAQSSRFKMGGALGILSTKSSANPKHLLPDKYEHIQRPKITKSEKDPKIVDQQSPKSGSIVRIKYGQSRCGEYLMEEMPTQLVPMLQLMLEMEEQGALPVLSDGAVAGNCGFSGRLLCEMEDVEQCNNNKDNKFDRDSVYYVSRSGKTAGKLMTGEDIVQVLDFDRKAWHAYFNSSSVTVKPTSDLPLYHIMLNREAVKTYRWQKAPNVIVHGHALADGVVASELGIPVSDRLTLFSTLEDMIELEKLLIQYPYPLHRCYIRRGHGFFILGDSVQEVRETFDEVIQPYLKDDVVALE
eukprot:TRINITY_DN64_c1_g1_i1.p1 TRINITY_DN64_c1_g1~~TRINITY_DN64_c1_g1_i1.p1  ORF type:complete len:374 (-),score=25.52 TRINITY_DN64_c1_g1_i1:356-1477(-)